MKSVPNYDRGDTMKSLAISSVACFGFLGGSAMAADMLLKAPPMMPAPVFSWTGLYIGVEGGWGETRSSVTRNVADAFYPVGFGFDTDFKGGLVGFEFGANYQYNVLVLGIEGDVQAANIQGDVTIFSPIVPGVSTLVHRDTQWVETVTGRLGFAWDRWLVFGKGGAAWRDVNEKGTNTTFNATGVVIAQTTLPNDTQFGYVVGGGIEWAPPIIDRLSLKVEYDWYNFGSVSSTSETCAFGACGVGTVLPAGQVTANSSTMWEIKGAINLRIY
jgi:outer membrane immunogenic protein